MPVHVLSAPLRCVANDGESEQKMTSPTEHEAVIDVRASPENVRVVRLALSGLAAHAGFSIDDLENTRIVVDEIAILLGLGVLPSSAHIRFCADAGPGWLQIRAELSDADSVVVDDPLALTVLEALTGECRVTAQDINCTLFSNSHSPTP